jgi:hypothetical protein
MKEFIIPFGFLIFVMGIGLMGWVTKSHFESKSYNNITGSNTSTWEAMWVELRVEGKVIK